MKEHIHEYYGGVCLCGKKQPTIRNGVEVGLSGISSNRVAHTRKISTKKNISSDFQLAVDELVTYLKEDVKTFPKYCGIVKQIGTTKARQWIKEMRGRGITNPRYFMGIYKQHNKQKNENNK